MAYVKNTWVDQKVERPKTYEMMNNLDGSVTLIDSFGDVTEIGTPVNADNMNHIEDGIANNDERITVLEKTNNLDNFVQKSGDTMTGTLIVESGDSAGIQLNAQQLDLTTTPTSAKRAKIQINDVNGIRFGTFECAQNADGSISSSVGVMLTKDDGSVTHSVIGPAFSADGIAYATAPTYTTYTDSSTKIATTAFLKNVLKGNGYGLASFSKGYHGHMTLANGIIFQWGLRNTTSNTYTLTFPKAFPTRMASIVITAANDSDNSTSEFKVSSITTTGCSIRSSDSTIGFYWFAIGY